MPRIEGGPEVGNAGHWTKHGVNGRPLWLPWCRTGQRPVSLPLRRSTRTGRDAQLAPNQPPPALVDLIERLVPGELRIEPLADWVLDLLLQGPNGPPLEIRIVLKNRFWWGHRASSSCDKRPS